MIKKTTEIDAILLNLNKAIDAHYQWLVSMFHSVVARDASKPEITDNHSYGLCQFGRWIDHLGPLDNDELPYVRLMDSAHQHMHNCGRELMLAIVENHWQDAHFDAFQEGLLSFTAALTDYKIYLLTIRSSMDVLTGLPGRRVLDESFDHQLRNAEPLNLYLMLLDIDRFKLVNDTYGHLIGDVVLRTLADGVLALLVVVVWGLNFVVIKVGLHNMPPLMLAGLRFMLVAFPAIFFVARPKVPLNLLLGYGLTISFAQFAFLFCAINFGMPAGLASLVLQAQAFFTIVLGAFTFGERLHGKQLAGIALAIFGVLVLIEDSLNGQHVAMLGFMLTLAAAFSWACGNIFNKKIMSHATRPAVMSLVIWSALIPIIPFFVASLILDGSATMIHSLVTIDMTTILSLMYLAFVATIVGYGIWGTLLGRYETWRVAPLSLLVPVVGLASAALLLDERLTGLQFFGAVLIMTGLYINVFGLRWRKAVKVRG